MQSASMDSPSKQAPVELVTESDLESVMAIFFKRTFSASTSDTEMASAFDGIQRKCVSLFSKDYTVQVIDNTGGSLSDTYPEKIVFLASPADDGEDPEARARELRQRMVKAREARARTRFVVPVILYEGKHICRSATLAVTLELGARKTLEALYGYSANMRTYLNFRTITGTTESTPTSSLENSQESTVSTDKLETSTDAVLSSSDEVDGQPSVAAETVSEGDASLPGAARKEDIQLLRLLSVHQICDLMLENKKEKLHLKVASSEKIDKYSRYQDFTLFQLPFPGCEFFEDYSQSRYKAKGLMFDWSQPFIDSELKVPDTGFLSELEINWANYKAWDLLTLTKNYMKVLLTTIANSDSGLLVHCISGWDRTPTFISMIRMSLWADNKIHQNLSPLEMAYLTVAYDWFLFSHDLPTRLKSNQEIFLFCFNMLKYISKEEFSVHILKQSNKNLQCLAEPFSEEPAENGASTAATEIPVIASSPPQEPSNGMCSDLFFSCTSISSDVSVSKASAEELSNSGRDAKKEPANGASTGDGDGPSSLEISTRRDFLAVQRPASSPAPPSPAISSPRSQSDTSWSIISTPGSTASSSPEYAARLRSSMRSRSSNGNAADNLEEDSTRDTEFFLQRRAERLKTVRALVRKIYHTTKEAACAPSPSEA